MARLTGAEVAALRIAASGLRGAPAPRATDEVVRGMLAIQAQELPSALWAVGIRGGGDEAVVRSALDDGRLVRAWTQRGTLHLVAAEDLPSLLALTGTRQSSAYASLRIRNGLDDDTLRRGGDVAERLLADGAPTRDEFATALRAEGLPHSGQPLSHLLYWLGFTGVLCLGPTAGAGQRLVPSPAGDAVEPATLVARYLRGHGPASEQDVARWFGITLATTRSALAALGDAVVRIESDLGALVADAAALGAPVPRIRTGAVRLLPPFDEHVVGFASRDHLGRHAGRFALPPNGRFPGVVLAGRDAVGTWSRTVRARSVDVEPAWFDADRPADVSAAVAEYARFLGRAAD